MKEYIKMSVSKNQKEYYLFNKIPIFILNKFQLILVLIKLFKH